MSPARLTVEYWIAETDAARAERDALKARLEAAEAALREADVAIASAAFFVARAKSNARAAGSRAGAAQIFTFMESARDHIRAVLDAPALTPSDERSET